MSRLAVPVAAPRLVGVACPSCHIRAATIALETGPVLIRHERRYQNAAHERIVCRGQWVAVPDARTGLVELRPVRQLEEANRVLRDAAERWLLDRTREMLQAFHDVYGYLPADA